MESILSVILCITLSINMALVPIAIVMLIIYIICKMRERNATDDRTKSGTPK